MFKKGNDKDLKNYRPISLLSVLYKILTKIINNLITRILDENQPCSQAGFRKHFSKIDHIHAVKETDPAKIFKMRFFANDILSSLLSIWHHKKRYMPTRSILPAAEAFAFSRPAGRLGELSHSIKAWYWLSFYRVIERFLSLSQHFFFQFRLLYNLVWKITYSNVKYVYDALKNGQTVVIAAQQHGALSYSIRACY